MPAHPGSGRRIHCAGLAKAPAFSSAASSTAGNSWVRSKFVTLHFDPAKHKASSMMLRSLLPRFSTAAAVGRGRSRLAFHQYQVRDSEQSGERVNRSSVRNQRQEIALGLCPEWAKPVLPRGHSRVRAGVFLESGVCRPRPLFAPLPILGHALALRDVLLSPPRRGDFARLDFLRGEIGRFPIDFSPFFFLLQNSPRLVLAALERAPTSLPVEFGCSCFRAPIWRMPRVSA